ncbi:MAG: hypothetical protein ACLRUN_14155 [Christensenellales bacterium]
MRICMIHYDNTQKSKFNAKTARICMIYFNPSICVFGGNQATERVRRKLQRDLPALTQMVSNSWALSSMKVGRAFHADAASAVDVARVGRSAFANHFDRLSPQAAAASLQIQRTRCRDDETSNARLFPVSPAF